MSGAEPKTATIHIRASPSDKNMLVKYAQRRGRSLSNYIVQTLIELELNRERAGK